MTICHLCLEDKKLQKKSHIIPDFMYKELYDEKHKLYLITSKEIRDNSLRKRMPNDAAYEKYILCHDCDNGIINRRYENYANVIFYSNNITWKDKPIFRKCINQHGLRFLNCQKVDYTKFKLFFLSILWRASISRLEMFSEIELKAEQNERLRQMIFNGDAGRVDEFPIFIYTYADDTNMPTDLVGQPGLIRTDDGFTKALFVINGYIFEIYIESETGDFPPEVLSETIKRTNDINIYYFPEGMAREFLLKYYILNNAST